MFCIVGTRILEFKTFGEVVVDLYGAELPATSDCILHHEVELGTVERSLAKLGAGIQPFFGTSLDDCLLGKMPVFVAAYVFFLMLWIAKRNLCFVVFELQSLEDVEDDVHHLEEFILDLVGSTEDMGVVLREAAHTCQTMQFTALFVAIDRAEFGKAQRQFAIRTRESAEYLAVVRAVHGFEQILFTFFRRVYRLERVFAVLGIVT